MTERELFLPSSGDGKFEVALSIGDNAYAIVLEAAAAVFHTVAQFVHYVTFHNCLALYGCYQPQGQPYG